ncbi:MAG: hypothetical protein HY228_03015 [Candidatus Yonathbacteria bacterium]|nr:hypothetical protein [Candidatus Yonathbacteria bacterium]
MLKKDLNKKTKNLFSLKGIISLWRDADPSKIEIAPYRDWRIMGIVFFVILLASFGFNMYLLFEVNRDNFFVVPEVKSQGMSFDREGLNRVLDLIATREATFEKLKTETVKVNDPSL